MCHLLLELCSECVSHQVFLLTCAALANMTTVDTLICDYLIQFDALTSLMRACNDNKAQSVFARDQVCVWVAVWSVIVSRYPTWPLYYIQGDKGLWLLASQSFKCPGLMKAGGSLADLLFHQLNSQCTHLELSRLTSVLFGG